MKIPNETISELISYLQGTCIEFDTACKEFNIDPDDITIEQLQEIDNWIFQCQVCGWWCERGDESDMGDGNICIDCCDAANDPEGY